LHVKNYGKLIWRLKYDNLNEWMFIPLILGGETLNLKGGFETTMNVARLM
jgi:hypothetical protein